MTKMGNVDRHTRQKRHTDKIARDGKKVRRYRNVREEIQRKEKNFKVNQFST